MAGRGPAPKSAATRRRRNKVSTRATRELKPKASAQAPSAKVTASKKKAPAAPPAVATPPVVEPGQAAGLEPVDLSGCPPLPERACSMCDSKPVESCAGCNNTRRRPYHRLTLEWWRDVWSIETNPFVDEYLPMDTHGLVRLAMLIDAFYCVGDIDDLKEIRLQEPRWGLDLMARRRLQWEVKRAAAPRQQAAPPSTATATAPKREDPRKVLFMEEKRANRA